ncbi:hypothetical protein MSKU15_0637 [Komagataeibacter diospyri]|nr:hypothetical protein MSKU15_0637 [Komagataeibacter diospyri]
MLQIGATKPYHDPLVNRINDVQELSGTHAVISRAKTEVQHRILTLYLPLYFPEVERFRGNTCSDWFFALLEQFPVPASITALGKDAFVAAAWDVVGRKVSKSRLRGDIWKTARTSIALPIAPDAPAIGMYRLVLGEARRQIVQRDDIEVAAIKLQGEQADFRRLQLVPSIGPIHALTIVATAGDLRRFRHHRQFLKFCGLDLSTYQSGQYRGKTKLSTRGNARLRRTLWMAVQVAIRQRENSFLWFMVAPSRSGRMCRRR